MKREKRPPVTIRGERSEFFQREDREIQDAFNPEDIIEFLKPRMERANNPEKENVETIAQCRALAAQMREIFDPKNPRHAHIPEYVDKVLAEARTLEVQIEKGDLHRAVGSAFLLGQWRVGLVVKTHEPNAALGRKKRASLRLGGKNRQEQASKETARSKKRALDLYQKYLDADYDADEIPAKIADRLKLDVATVNRYLGPRKKRTSA